VEATTTDGFLPTIPFVFADIADKGIPKYGKYYESGNAFDFPNQSRLVPATLHGLIRESGKDYVTLSDAAPNYNIAGTHITINYFLQGIGEVTEYRKIREYDTGNKHAKLDGIWHIGVPPPAGAKFQVGAASFVQASAFEKRFAYLASANESNQGVPFADGREPDTIQNP
jgi:hypothetical protein